MTRATSAPRATLLAVVGVVGLLVLVATLLFGRSQPTAEPTSTQTPEPSEGTTIAASAYRAVEPERVLAARQLVADEPVTFTLRGVPEGTTAVALYVTAARNADPTTVAVCPGTRVTETCVDSSALIVEPDRPAGAYTLVQLDVDNPWQVTLSASDPVTVFVDGLGYMVHGTDPGDSLHVPVGPFRALDAVRIEPRTAHTVTLDDVPAGATAAVVSLSSSDAAEATYLAACPGGQEVSACARTSTLNAVPTSDRYATTVVGLGGPNGDQIQVYSNGEAGSIAADVTGYFVRRAVQPDGGSWQPLAQPAVLERITAASAQPTIVSLPEPPEGATAAIVRVAARGAWQQTALSACPGTSVTEDCSAAKLMSIGPDGRASTTALVVLDPSNPGDIVLTSSDASVSVDLTVLGYLAPPVGDTEPANLAPEEPERPGATTTGVPDGTELTRHDGDLVITEAGTQVDGLDIHGFVSIQAPGVTIRNSIIRGGTATQGTGLLTNTSGHEVVIEDSELFAAEPSSWIDGLRGGDITARRLNIHDVIDPVHIYGDNVRIEESWLHDNLHFEEDPAHDGGPSHDDSIQIQQGSNIDIIGNDISGATNTAIQFTQDQGRVADVRIIGNWIDGGSCAINLSEKGRGPFEGIVIADNVFGRDTAIRDCAIIAPSSTEIDAGNNVYVDGEPTTVRPG